MDTNGATATDNRQAPTDNRQAASAADGRQARQATTGKRLTRQEAAEKLGLSVSALRRLQDRLGVTGDTEPAEHGGTVCLLSEQDVARLSAATDKRQATAGRGKRGNRQAASGRRQPTGDRRQAADADELAAGWRAALAAVEAERDRLRSERDAAVERAEQAERHASEAERGRGQAEQRLENLRAAWWRWYALARRPWWRLRRLPDPPAELVADRLLAKPEG